LCQEDEKAEYPHWPPARRQGTYVTAIGGHLRLVADFGQATTTFIDYTEALTA
jgi:hypothetical protein